MKITPVAFSVAITTYSLLAASADTPPQQASHAAQKDAQTPREAVAAAHARWLAGILGRYDVLAEVLAPDVSLRFPGGSQWSRSSYLNLLETKQAFYDSADHHEMEVRVYGDAAVVTGKSTLQGRFKANAFSERLAYTAVYIRAGAK